MEHTTRLNYFHQSCNHSIHSSVTTGTHLDYLNVSQPTISQQFQMSSRECNSTISIDAVSPSSQH